MLHFSRVSSFWQLSTRARLVSLVWLFCWAITAGYASTTVSPVTKHYGIENGLPTNVIYDAIQDSHHRLWLATDRGVVRFDGNEFELFDESDGLCPGEIIGIREDQSGNVWFYSFTRKLAFYSYETHRIEQHPVNEELAGIARGAFAQIDFSGKQIWLSGFNSAILQVDTAVQVHRHEQQGLFIYEVSDDCFAFNHSTNSQFKKGGVILRGLRDTIVLADSLHFVNQRVHRTSSGDYIMQSPGQLMRLAHTLELHTYPVSFEASNAFAEDRSGGIWLGSFSNGLFHYPQGDLATKPEQFLDGYSVSAVVEDHQGGLWASTLRHGLFYFSNLQVKELNLGEEVSLNDAMLSRFQNSVSILWGNNSFAAFSAENPTVENRSIRLDEAYLLQQVPLQDGVLLQKPRLSDFVFVPWDPTKPVYKVNTERKIRLGGSWEGHFLGARMLSNQRIYFWEGAKSTHPTDSLKWDGRRIRRVILSGSDQGYLLDAVDRLHYFNLGDRSIGKVEEDGLQEVQVLHAVGVSGGGIVLGQNGHLYWLKGTKVIHRSSPFPNRDILINGLYKHADHEELFLLTNKGIWRMNSPADSPELVINRALGLNADQVISMVWGPHGLWASTSGGICIVPDFDIYQKSPSLALIQVDQCTVDDVQIDSTGLLHLPRNFAPKRLKFSGVDFRNALRIKYRYRLSANQPWTVLENHELLLFALDPGDYQLEVQAANAVGEWGPTTSWSISVERPVWSLPWFWPLISLILIVMAWILLQYWLAQSKRELAMRESLLKSQSQALTAQLNPHFIFNAMNALASMIARNDSKNSIRFLSMLAKLMRSVFDHSQLSRVPVIQEIESLQNYLELQQLRFNFAFEVKLPEELETLQTPPMLLQPLVENAVVHGIQGVADKRILLEVSADECNLTIAVHNTGTSFIPSESPDQEVLRSLSLIRNRLAIIHKLTGNSIELFVGPSDIESFATKAALIYPLKSTWHASVTG